MSGRGWHHCLICGSPDLSPRLTEQRYDCLRCQAVMDYRALADALKPIAWLPTTHPLIQLDEELQRCTTA